MLNLCALGRNSWRSPTLSMPTLETNRLFIREFTMDDLDDLYRIIDLDVELEVQSYEERRQYVQWSIMNYEALARLYQPPYGDRVVVLKESSKLIGAAGLVPCWGPFGTLPYYVTRSGGHEDCLNRPEMGLYYAIDGQYQRQGYATEAAQALIDFAFQHLQLSHMIATTDYDNLASQGVMRRLGMIVERNPYPDPEWFQVVGILANPRSYHELRQYEEPVKENLP